MIDFRHVQKVVAQSTLLEIEALQVAAGSAVAMVGLTAQAREMMLALLSGRSQPTAGTIKVAGSNPAQSQALLTRVMGVLPAENNLYPRLTVRRNLLFFCEIYGLAASRADEVLHQVGLADQAQMRAGDLLPDLARRLAFGRAILHDPALLVLVDPFVDGTVGTVDLLMRLCQDLREGGTTLFFMVSQVANLLALCQMIYVVEGGRLVDGYEPAAEKGEQKLPFKIPARLDGKVALINPGDILYVVAEESRTVLCTGNGRVPTHLTLNEVEQRLARSGFFRAHRSYLVNLQHITEVIAYTRNSYTLILEDGSEIPLSKGAARELRELLDY